MFLFYFIFYQILFVFWADHILILTPAHVLPHRTTPLGSPWQPFQPLGFKPPKLLLDQILNNYLCSVLNLDLSLFPANRDLVSNYSFRVFEKVGDACNNSILGENMHSRKWPLCKLTLVVQHANWQNKLYYTKSVLQNHRWVKVKCHIWQTDGRKYNFPSCDLVWPFEMVFCIILEKNIYSSRILCFRCFHPWTHWPKMNCPQYGLI